MQCGSHHCPHITNARIALRSLVMGCTKRGVLVLSVATLSGCLRTCEIPPCIDSIGAGDRVEITLVEKVLSYSNAVEITDGGMPDAEDAGDGPTNTNPLDGGGDASSRVLRPCARYGIAEGRVLTARVVELTSGGACYPSVADLDGTNLQLTRVPGAVVHGDLGGYYSAVTETGCRGSASFGLGMRGRTLPATAVRDAQPETTPHVGIYFVPDPDSDCALCDELYAVSVRKL